LRGRLRPLLQRLHFLPALSEQREPLFDQAALEPGDAVVDVGALLTPEAAERVAPDGDVLAVDPSVDRLEEVRRACRAPNVFYLLGTAEVLPLTDAAVDAILAPLGAIDRQAADEFLRVLRSGGLVSVFEPDEDRTDSALNLREREVGQIFSGAGFAEVSVALARGRLYGTARKP
jgi:ubiquinone/menaquinone biosynthesis C-methylase UbiE